MFKRSLQLLLLVSSIIYFTIILAQSSSASSGKRSIALHQSTSLWASPHLTGTQSVRLDGLQVQVNGVSSRYRITNLSNQVAIVDQHFHNASDDAFRFTQFNTQLAPASEKIVDLATIPGANGLVGWTGYVIINAYGTDIMSPNQPSIIAALLPAASFLYTIKQEDPSFTVRFTNHSIHYTSVVWDFGDGQTSTEVSPIHTYAISGTYTVKLTVSTLTESATKSATINVRGYRPIHPDGWDLSFGENGRVNSGCNTESSLLHLQPDGKIVVAGSCSDGLALFRYLSNGKPDVTLDQDGRLALPNGDFRGIALQRGDKVLVVYAHSLQRYHNNGALDTTFGDQGTVTLFANADHRTRIMRVGVKSDDRIVLAGMKEEQPIVVQLTSDGVWDSSFNGQGYVTLPLKDEPTGSSWHGLGLPSDGKIVVGRTQTVVVDPFYNRSETNAVVARYTATGQLDPDFGTEGLWNSRSTSGPAYGLNKLAVQPDGHIIVNIDEDHAGPSVHVFYRLLPTGTVDSSFIDSPSQTFVTMGYSSNLHVDAAGYIWIAGASTLRLLPTGHVDTTFGKAGYLSGNIISIDILPQPDGDVLLNTATGLLRYVSAQGTPVASPKPLALLYAVLDNNLGDQWARLVNNVEAGVRPDMQVRLLVDGPTDNDVYVYDVQQDANPYCPSSLNPTCNGRYVEGSNFWRLTNENSAHPESLYQFLVDALKAHPNSSQITLALIGHGSGWSANVLPGQPSVWRNQNDTIGGMLWDDHPGAGQTESRSLSTKALGQALTWAGEQTGKKIDLLYLDGCSMGMAEVAYEVRTSTRYLLASPNIDWASFTYDALLPELLTANGQDVGKRWLAMEATAFRATPGYPFTLSLLDLSQMNALAANVSTLADSLRAMMPNENAQLLAAFNATDRFDSDYDGDLDAVDAYSDLPAFIAQLRQVLPNESALLQATQALSTTLAATIVAKDQAGGSPWVFPNQNWQWRNYGGLGIYLPLGQDEVRRQIFYQQSNLAWTADTTWDEFLANFWANNVAAAQTQIDMPVCRSTTQGCQGLANPLPVQTPPEFKLYFSVVKR